MYIDLIILIILLVFIFIYGKHFQTYIFGIAMVDILFRCLTFLKNNLPISKYIKDYVPEDIPSIIYKYTDDTISILLMWTYVIIMIIFLYFVIKIFIKRKKIG